MMLKMITLLLQLQQKFYNKHFSKCLLLMGLLISLFFPLGASALFEAGSSVSEAKLTSSVEGVGDQITIWVDLDIHLKPGWKTYWRTPGASGYGMKIDWSASQNLKSAEFYWPAPVKFETFKLIANGYKDEVIFPIQVTLAKQHAPLVLKGNLDYLACDEGNCIPQTKTVTLIVPDKPSIPSANANEIASAIKRLPEKNNPDLTINSVQFIYNENTESYLRLIVFHKLPLVSPEIFIEGAGNLYFDKKFSLQENHNTSVIDIPIYNNEKKEQTHVSNVIGKKLTITLASGKVAIEKTVSVISPPLSTQDTFIMYGFAFLGGFILNFMPCVLPIILLKIFSLTKYGGMGEDSVRRALFFSIMGIISSFIVLGLISIGFSSLGVSFGWGMQFQEPIFLVIMMLMLTLFAANFWGFYEIILPEPLTSLGYEYTEREGNIGDFLSGMFATLLATPCSAPYLGTAITFALSRGATEILLIFFFLGLGLSFPFILVMMFPKIATHLPKPGQWMYVFKHVLGWGFFLTVIWLFYVLSSQVPYNISVFILIIMLFIPFFFWLRKKIPSYRRVFTSGVIIVFILPFLTLSLEHMKEKQVISKQENIKEASMAIKSNLQKGQVVFVIVTADWCITCKANEFLVLDTQNVKNLLKENHVKSITIDWTSKDPSVYEYLKSFNHNGIPFFAVYGPHKPYGQPLPQILTYSIVNEAIKNAK